MLKLLTALSIVFPFVRLQGVEHLNYYNLPYNNARTQYRTFYPLPFFQGDKRVIRKPCYRRSNVPSNDEWVLTSSWPYKQINNNNSLAYNPVLESESLMGNEKNTEYVKEEQTNVNFYPTQQREKKSYQESDNSDDNSLIILTKKSAYRLLKDCFSHIGTEQSNKNVDNMNEDDSKFRSDIKTEYNIDSSISRRFMVDFKDNEVNKPLIQDKDNFDLNENDTSIERNAENVPNTIDDIKTHTELRASQVENEPNLSQKSERIYDSSNKNTETDVYNENLSSMPSTDFNRQSEYKNSLPNQELDHELYEPTQSFDTSKIFESRFMLMKNPRVCYACSTISDPTCWNPDRRTTVKYCRRGHEECVTKTFKIKESLVITRDCATTCQEELTQYKSCSICHKDLCNSATSLFVYSQLIVTILFIVYKYTI